MFDSFSSNGLRHGRIAAYAPRVAHVSRVRRTCSEAAAGGRAPLACIPEAPQRYTAKALESRSMSLTVSSSLSSSYLAERSGELTASSLRVPCALPTYMTLMLFWPSSVSKTVAPRMMLFSTISISSPKSISSAEVMRRPSFFCFFCRFFFCCCSFSSLSSSASSSFSYWRLFCFSCFFSLSSSPSSAS